MNAMHKLSLANPVDQVRSDLQAVQEVLDRRAGRLAQAPLEQDTSAQVDLLLACLGSEVYGMEAQYVERVQQVDHLTHVPRVPQWVAGVTNLRGKLLSVIDLASLFGLDKQQAGNNGDTQSPGSSPDCLIVVNTPAMELALLVDDVLAVETIPISRIREPVSTLRGLHPEYVRGMIERADGSMVTMLDLVAFLADERLVVHQEVN